MYPTSPIARFAVPILALGVIAIGFSPILVRLSEVGPIATAVNRMALPVPFLLAMLWLRPQDRGSFSSPRAQRDFWIIALSGIFFAGDLALWHLALGLTSVANATVLSNLAPVFVVLGAWLIFKEHIRGLFVVGLALAVTGVAILMSGSVSLVASTLQGDVLGIASSTFYGGYILCISHARRRFSTPAIMAIGGISASIVLWIFAAILEGQVWPHTFNGWLVALGLAFPIQMGGQVLIALALAHVSASFGATVLLLQPVVAAILAWVLFGEQLDVEQSIGGIAILAGIAIARRASLAPDAATTALE